MAASRFNMLQIARVLMRPWGGKNPREGGKKIPGANQAPWMVPQSTVSQLVEHISMRKQWDLKKSCCKQPRQPCKKAQIQMGTGCVVLVISIRDLSTCCLAIPRKRSYVYAELDSKRPNITQQEASHFTMYWWVCMATSTGGTKTAGCSSCPFPWLWLAPAGFLMIFVAEWCHFLELSLIGWRCCFLQPLVRPQMQRYWNLPA